MQRATVTQYLCFFSLYSSGGGEIISELLLIWPAEVVERSEYCIRQSKAGTCLAARPINSLYDCQR